MNMGPILPKHQMSEEDIKLQYITPSITSKWSRDKITMETRITDGKINLKGNFVFREKPKRADYILYLNANNPIAVVEAKDNTHSVSHGLQQAMTYAKMLDVPFAYSSNGDGFAEHDFLTGQEREFGLDEFPTEQELVARYKQESGLTPQQEILREQPYYTSQNTYPPRYYQRNAINRTVDAIARGQQRLLLVMATGTGKTYTAFQIVYRLLQSGMKRKILYLADRNILVDQSIQQDFAPLEKVTHKINVAKDDKSTITSHEVYFSLYQQLVGDDDQEHFSELFTPDFFDLIIVDECHLVNPIEGMYKDFFDAVKCKVLGLTATPYRLSSSRDFGSMLKFITRTKPHVFSEVIYHVQVSTLLDMGYLAKLDYYSMNPSGWNELNLKVNTTGADYTDRSVQKEYERIDFYGYLVHIVQRLMNPKAGGKRKGILVFTRFLKEAERLTMSIPGCAIVSGDTPKKEREHILEAFKAGEIPVVANVGVLTTGFDYPELDTVVMARPTMSLAMWYQIVGRAIRPHPSKECGWIVDLCGNIKRFGEVSDLRLFDSGNGKWAVFSNGRQLTNVRF